MCTINRSMSSALGNLNGIFFVQETYCLRHSVWYSGIQSSLLSCVHRCLIVCIGFKCGTVSKYINIFRPLLIKTEYSHMVSDAYSSVNCAWAVRVRDLSLMPYTLLWKAPFLGIYALHSLSRSFLSITIFPYALTYKRLAHSHYHRRAIGHMLCQWCKYAEILK